MINPYYDKLKFTEEEIKKEVHRVSVGGIWEEQSNLQLNICKKYGLTPESKFLDFGCGCFRGGVKFIEFLNKGNYYGIDVNNELMRVGVEHEIVKANLQEKLVIDNLLINDNFYVDFFGINFDIIFAQSVFTHLTLNHFDFFIQKSFNVLKTNGKLLISFWLIEEDEDITKDKIFTSDNFSIKTRYIFDAFHYKFSQLEKIIDDRWDIKLLDDYHPRKQKFILITKK